MTSEFLVFSSILLRRRSSCSADKVTLPSFSPNELPEEDTCGLFAQTLCFFKVLGDIPHHRIGIYFFEGTSVNFLIQKSLTVDFMNFMLLYSSTFFSTASSLAIRLL
ncbi:hypothetical protein CEXT_45741 [Caerostris extrusa]|uniref:Uncharacterized protein n=1 Tax=Caerostris extrusa TaxID=172846 RepID=A0AAV4MWQ4_CAEEX|nr:hypothetical protein CEXT_45741 [Caerostris extrusa]